MKICAECRHCVEVTVTEVIGPFKCTVDRVHYSCKKFSPVDMITGNIQRRLKTCIECRNDSQLCGVDAKHWEPKEVTP